MTKTLALFGALACAVAFAGSASAQSWGVSEDTPWRFRSSDQTAVLQNNVNLIELQKSGYYDLIKSGGGGAGGGVGAGMLGATTSSTQNFFQVIQQTTNNCSATAVGAVLTCGSGAQNVSGTSQNSTGNTTNSSTTVTDNVVTNKDNVSNNGNGTQNVAAAGPQ